MEVDQLASKLSNVVQSLEDQLSEAREEIVALGKEKLKMEELQQENTVLSSVLAKTQKVQRSFLHEFVLGEDCSARRIKCVPRQPQKARRAVGTATQKIFRD